MTIYRRLIKSECFHWMPQCPNLPGNSCIEVRIKKGERPKKGELCKICLAKERDKEAAAKLKRSKS